MNRAVEHLQSAIARGSRIMLILKLLPVRLLVDLPCDRLRTISMVKVDVEYDCPFNPMFEMCYGNTQKGR
jgi:hypothetical protein